MTITATTVRACAAIYSLPELRQKIRDAMAKLGQGSVIVSVSGPGTSYSRQLVLTPQEEVELYQKAIDYKMGQLENPVMMTPFYDPGTAC